MIDKLFNFLRQQKKFEDFNKDFPKKYEPEGLTWDKLAPDELRKYFKDFPEPKPFLRIWNGDYFICEFMNTYLIINLWSFPLNYEPNLIEYEILLFPEEVWEKYIKPDIEKYYAQV